MNDQATRQTNDRDSAAGPAWTYRKRGYALATSLRQLRLRKFASLSTLLVLGVTLSLPVLLTFAAGTLAKLGTRGVEGESLTLYLDMSVGDLEGATLAQQLLGRDGIRETRYVSRDEALEVFRTQSDVGAALEALGDNPLPGAIIVFPDGNTLTATRVELLANSLRKLPEVEQVQFDLRWVKRLHAVVSLIRLVGGVLAVFLTLTALMVIGNTIRLELIRRQEEMEVASLLGANRRFMHRPILYTGALYGFLGGLVAAGIAMWTFYALRHPTNDLSRLYDSGFRLEMPTASHFLAILAVATLLGLIGAVTSLYRPSRQLSAARK